METARTSTSASVGLIVAATTLALGTIALIWFAAVPWGPMWCPAIYPAPRNCFASDRAGTGLVATVMIAAVYLATMLFALNPMVRSRPLVITGVALLGIAPVVSYLAVAWIPGFALG